MSVALMQLIPQSLPLTQFGVFRPPLAIEAVVGAARAGVAGDCIGAVAGFDFIMPEKIEGFLAGVGAAAIGFEATIGVAAGTAAAALHEIRLWVVGSWQ